MAIPDYQTLMLRLLEYASDGQVCSLREAYSLLSDKFGLTGEEREELLPSGRQQIINNRVGWAKTYMVKAGLLEMVKNATPAFLENLVIDSKIRRGVTKE